MNLPALLTFVTAAFLINTAPVDAAPTDNDGIADGTDLILSNGQIRTPTGWAQAIAVRHGVIVAIGESKND